MSGLHHVRSVARSLLSTTTSTRPFASAAVLHLDYSDDEEDNNYWDHDRRRPQELTCGDKEGRSIQWVFMGSPGAQKHVYAARISRLLDVPYISMGSLVRQELNPRSSLYKQIANAVNEGKLVSENIVFALLSKRLEDGYQRGESGFILDGIPRTCVQAEILDQIADIDLVVNLKCKDCYAKNHLGVGVCSYCGKPSRLSISKSPGFNLETRTWHNQLQSDVQDVVGICEEKLCFSRQQNQLLEDYYRKQMKLLDFHVAGGPGDTWQGLLAALHLQQIDAISSSSSSQKLTT